jgi:hypothetical protein
MQHSCCFSGVHHGDPTNSVRFGTECFTKCFDCVLLSFFWKSSTEKRRSKAPLIGTVVPTGHPTNNDNIPRKKAPSNFISHRYGASTAQWAKNRLRRSLELSFSRTLFRSRIAVSSSRNQKNGVRQLDLADWEMPSSCRESGSPSLPTRAHRQEV